MSVNYDLYETPDLAKSGEEQPLHARVVLKGSYTAEEFVEQVAQLRKLRTSSLSCSAASTQEA